MLDLRYIMIGAQNSVGLAEFYERVLEKKPGFVDGDWYGFDVGSAQLTIGPHDKITGPSTQPERIMLNFATDDVKGEFERLKKLEVKVIAEPYSPGNDMWIATLADPEGNYFQLVTPWESNA